MLKRLRSFLAYVTQTDHLRLLEAALTGLLFVQALRYVVGELYARTASTTLIEALPASAIDPTLPGLVDPSAVANEIILLGLLTALPALTIILGRWRLIFVLVVGMIAAGRVLMIWPDSPISALMAAEIAVGGGLLYLALLIYNRATLFPYFFIFGFGVDQIIRAYGDTLDPSWSPAYINIQIGLSVTLLLLALLTTLRRRSARKEPASANSSSTVDPNRGILSIWGGIGLGALLFLQVALLATPNAIAGRADTDYTLFVPLLIGATLLPIVPFVRIRARSLIAPFDSSIRGWIWLIIIVVLLVIGTRIIRLPLAFIGLGNFPLGGVALVLAQLAVSLLWWWFVRPKAERERNFSGLWLVLAPLIFALFVTLDLFTYEYAFVRDFAPPFDDLNAVIPPLLRGLRGMGLGVLLVATLLAAMPMIQSTRRVPWTGARGQSLLPLLLVIAASALGSFFARPPVIQPVVGVNELRIGTYNIHAGYSEFYDYNLEAIARTIQASGADVVLLQEVEKGRLTSFGVDQTLWLARRLNMDRRFFPTNEGLQGLAILSKVPIVFDDGVLLPSVDQQTGMQRVQIQPDEGVLTIYNTSLGLLLQAESIEEQEANQRTQLNFILRTIEAHIRNDYGGQLGRAILGGTFHNVPDSPLIDVVRQTGFNDPFAGSNIELTTTLLRADRSGRVDYLWLWAQTLPAIGNNVIDSRASDHRMAVVGVQIRRDS